MQVGNLAHSLKTPIAVLLNETRAMEPDRARIVEEQATAMRNQVQHYLDRARIAAQQNSVLVRCDTRQALERLVRVMERLNPDTSFDLQLPPDVPDLAMEQHDVEELFGNVLENAGKWTDDRISISAEVLPADPSEEGRRWVELHVDDNGPGMPEDQLTEAMKRGRRLDESKPGTGLGLSIIKEIAEEYRGSVRLNRSELGGLRVTLKLPIAVR